MSKSRQQDLTIEEDDAVIPVGVETAIEAALTTNVYGEIRKRLVRRGIPEDEVAFIHDAKNHAQREAI